MTSGILRERKPEVHVYSGNLSRHSKARFLVALIPPTGSVPGTVALGKALKSQSFLLSSLLVSEMKRKRREVYFPQIRGMNPPLGGRRSCRQFGF